MAEGDAATQTPAGAHVVVVDDDAELRHMLHQLLTREGLAVTTVPDGAGLNQAMTGGRVDLVVLDLNLNGESGLDLARHLRASGDTPILILTAAGDPIDRVIGFELGADDYLVKPFHSRELLGRVRSLLRRTFRSPARHDAPSQPGSWSFDSKTDRLCSHEGEVMPLSTAERALLRLFASQPGVTLSRRQLLAAEGGSVEVASDRSIDLRIARLRRKLRAAPGTRPLIRTIRGRGYVFEP